LGRGGEKRSFERGGGGGGVVVLTKEKTGSFIEGSATKKRKNTLRFRKEEL